MRYDQLSFIFYRNLINIVPQLYTGKVPFAEPKMTMYRVSKKVLKGDRPPQPTSVFGTKMLDVMWQVVQTSWKQQPEERATASEIENAISEFTST